MLDTYTPAEIKRGFSLFREWRSYDSNVANAHAIIDRIVGVVNKIEEERATAVGAGHKKVRVT